MSAPVKVLLTIVSRQQYHHEAPDTAKLVTEGTMCREGDMTVLQYEETELTGLSGTTTTFRVRPGHAEVERTGTLTSRMVFEPGQDDQSLYQMDVGTLMLRILTEEITVELCDDGGFAHISYAIDIEGQPAGRVDYRIDVQKLSR